MVKFPDSALTAEKAERVRANVQRVSDRAATAHRAWATMLLVGNAGGLIAAAGRILQLDPRVIQFLLPSCWLFSAGLAVAGLAMGVEAVRIGLMTGALSRHSTRAHDGEIRELSKWWDVVEDGGLFLRTLAELVSAALFLTAIWLPLLRLSPV